MRTQMSIVVAVSENGVIGRHGQLPWHLPDDLRRFRRLTMGNTVLMGRRTWESLGKPLDGRDNWVLTRDPGFAANGVRTFHCLEEVYSTQARGRLMVIGGAELYRQTLPVAVQMELTEVHARVDGDVFFPALVMSEWVELAREPHPRDDRHAYAFDFVRLNRRVAGPSQLIPS